MPADAQIVAIVRKNSRVMNPRKFHPASSVPIRPCRMTRSRPSASTT
jgi:hypothetical protein